MTLFELILRLFSPPPRKPWWATNWPYTKIIARYSGPAAEKWLQGTLIPDFVQAFRHGSSNNLKDLLDIALLPPVQSISNEMLNQQNRLAMIGLLENRDRYGNDTQSQNSRDADLRSPLWFENIGNRKLFSEDIWIIPEKANEPPIDTFDVTISWPYQKIEPYLAQACGLIAKHWCFAPQIGGLGEMEHWQMRLKLRHGLDYRSARALITAALWFPNLAHISNLYEKRDMSKGRLRRWAGVAMQYTHVEPTRGQASQDPSQAFYGYVADPKTLQRSVLSWWSRQ